MTESPSSAAQRRAASDPKTPRTTLADLAYDHPDLRVAIALNPSTYDGLIEWLGELGDAEVTAVIAKRATDATTAQAASAIEPAAESKSETVTATSPQSEPRPSMPSAKLSSRLMISTVSVVAVLAIAAIVAGSAYAYTSFTNTIRPASTAAAVSSASDYRFGATTTWQTNVKVVASPTDGSAGYYASVESYPGLWLVSWPGDDSGSGRLTDETLLGMDPASGTVMWSMTGGPYQCAPSLAAGALLCVDSRKATLMVLDPLTGQAAGSSLNGVSADSVDAYRGDVVIGSESGGPGEPVVVDTVERAKLDGTVLWKKSGTCSGVSLDEAGDTDGMTVSTADQLNEIARSFAKVSKNDAFVYGPCLSGTIDLDTGSINVNATTGDDGCEQYSPFETDGHGLYAYGDPCVATTYPMLIPRGDSTLTAITMQNYAHYIGDDSTFPTLWSVDLPGARLDTESTASGAVAHLGSYALLQSAGNLYGVATKNGTSWLQSDEFSGDQDVVLLPIDATKANTPVLALESDRNTVVRLDPGFGAARVSAEPASLPSCPTGQSPVSFTSWHNGKGATLVCQGFTRTVTVVLIIDGTTYTSTNGSITPTGYYAAFGGNLSVDIGLGGWAAWVRNGSTTTLHPASSGWQVGDQHASAFPALKGDVETCPAGTYPLSLSTWNGGWLLTCGKTADVITRFVYVDGSAHGSGSGMTTQGAESCGTTSTGRQVCVSASPAVVAFSSKTGTQTQHPVDANYVVGNGFSGAGKGTGAYGLPDPGTSATSEVAYLNGILQQSKAARSSVKVVVQNILRCASVQADVRNAQAVADARSTELQALSSAPVDAVPDGSTLVSTLRAALQYSLTADTAYVTAAGQVADGECSAGKATYNAQASVLTRGTNEKTAFTRAWNGQIASEFGTPTYTQNDI